MVFPEKLGRGVDTKDGIVRCDPLEGGYRRIMRDR